MKLNFTHFVIGMFLLLILVGVGAKFMTTNGPGEYDEFAQCLTENGAVMYGAEWCHNCQNQKEMFGKSFQYIDYVECETTPEICEAEAITGYPAWKKHEGGNSSFVGKGTQPLELLAEAFECELPLTD
ncbi:hypothetical protein HOG48_03965 [Candidatus Peregrinibacteria bacterium]|jgi:hypothetical protein|nr:hypothetical protein [Candidatus Peregrinibacteria bacterium]